MTRLVSRHWRVLWSLFLILSLVVPVFQPGEAASGTPVIDGVKDAVWGAPVANDPAGDMTETNLDLQGLYVLDDATNLYVGFDASASDWGMAYGLYIDIDGIPGSGGTTDPWGRAITAVSQHRPEFALYVWHDGGTDTIEAAQLTTWNGSGWDYPTLISLGGQQAYGAAGDWIEYAIPKSILGNPPPATVALELFTTGGDGHAQDSVPSDPNVAYTTPDFGGDTTRLSAFVRYSLSEKFINVAGSFGSELGGNDWDPSDGTTRMTDDNQDGVWKFTTASIPAGDWAYKVVEDQNWDTAYPPADVALSGVASGQAINFYYHPGDHLVHDSLNQCIATVAGDFQSELGGADWSPDSLVSWMTDPDGDRWYEFTAELPAGAWMYKVARDEAWTTSYPSDNVTINLSEPTEVTFRYNCDTNEVQDSTSGGGPGAGHDNDIWWDQLGHNSRDGLYRNPTGPVPAGTPVILRLRSAAGDLTSATLRVYNDRTNVEALLPMSSAYNDGTYEWWEATIPASSVPTIYWYRFIATDGTDTDYYEDDGAFDGGWGAPLDDSLDRSWQLTVYDPAFETPDWVKNAVIYQVFPDRFRDGDPSNNPPPGRFFYNETPGTIYRSNDTEWNTPICDPRDANDCPGTYSKNFYGGDLQGLIDQLGYLEDLGVTAIYLNPIFESPSNHKYDTTDYSLISMDFGDLDTFHTLVDEAHARGMRIILDGVFNHTSSDSIYFDRYGRYAEVGACESPASPYRAWYFFTDVTPGTGACAGSDGTPQGANYESWFGFDSLPKLNSANPEVRALIWDSVDSVARYWLRQGADGWRLDVGGDVDQGQVNSPDNDYWEGFRAAVRAEHPEAYIVGEEWGNATSWTIGGEWDATMNYQYSSAMLSFWRDTEFVDNDHNSGSSAGTLTPLGPSQLDGRLRNWQERYAPEAFYAMMNLLGSHDTNRPLFMLDPNTGANTPALYEDPNYDWSEAIERLKGVLLLQMTLPGAPTIYYGDEVGLVGPVAHDGSTWQDDPYNRQPYPWLDETGTPFYTHLQTQAGQDELRDYYRSLIAARHDHPALRTGSFDPLLVDDASGVYAYGRRMSDFSDAALVIVNQNDNDQAVTLELGGYLPYGAQFDSVLDGATVTASGSGELSLTVPANGGAVLVLDSAIASYPQAVTDLSATAGQGEVDLNWSEAPGASSYDVYRSRLSGGGYEFVANTTGTSYTDTGLENSTRYYYVVTGRDDAIGLESERSNEVLAVPQFDLSAAWYNLQWPPSIAHTISAVQPTENIYGQIYIAGATDTTAGQVGGIQAQVGWGPADEAPSEASWQWSEMVFNVEAGNNDEYVGSLLPDQVGTFAYTTRWSADNGASWFYTDLDGPPYSADQAGVLVVNPSSDTDEPAAPQNLRIANTSTGSIQLAWDANTEADLAGYEVYRRPDGMADFELIARVEAGVTTYTDAGVEAFESYTYYLLAFDASFNRSAPSDPITGTAEPRLVQVTFNLTVPASTPADGTVYIAGEIPGLPVWDPGAAAGAMTKVDATHWTKTLEILDGSQIQFKFTRGNWESVEKEADGNTEIPNRTLSVSYGTGGEQAVNLTVENWRDPIVTAHTPEAGAVDVPVDSVVTVSWNQEMPDNTRFTVSGPAGETSGQFSYEAASDTVTFTPDPPLAPGATYTVTVSGAVDVVGDLQLSPVTWTFTTQAAQAEDDVTVNAFRSGNGVDTVEVDYTITGTVDSLVLGFFRSADSGFDPGDEVLATVTITEAADLAHGSHTRTFTLGTDINLVGEAQETDDEYFLLAVADPAGSLMETDEDNNSAPFAGVYRSGGYVFAHGTAQDDSLVVGANGSVALNGQAFPAQPGSTAFRLRGHAGADVLDARSAPSGTALLGGAGDDQLYGGAHNDRIDGGEGRDEALFTANLPGGVTANLETGQASGHGSDTLVAIEDLTGSNFSDTLVGDDNDNILRGGPGNDNLSGQGGADELYGEAGNDTISGGEGDDTLDGGAGNDTILGGDGNDTARGGDGNDTIAGEGGADMLFGENGNDHIYASGMACDPASDDGQVDEVDGGPGRDTAYANLNQDLLANVETQNHCAP